MLYFFHFNYDTLTLPSEKHKKNCIFLLTFSAERRRWSASISTGCAKNSLFTLNKCKKLNSLKHLVRTTVAGSHN